MNIQAMMKQAQKLQKDMLSAKDDIDNKIFIGKSSLVTVEVMGNKKINKVSLNIEELESDDKEMLEDMILTALNDAMNQIDKETESKMGKFTNGMPGLF